jgi:chaperonin GroES
MNVRPLRDRELVKRVEEQEQRIGGIIIPDTAKEAAAGQSRGRRNRPRERRREDDSAGCQDRRLRAGGKVRRHGDQADGEEYLIVREDEILGVAEGVPELATV